MPRQEYHFNENGVLVKGRPPLPPAPTEERYLTGGALGDYLMRSDKAIRGAYKYGSERERIKHMVKQAWDQGGFSAAALKKSAKDMHYFPRSAADYAAMKGFDGRTVK